MNRPRKQPLRAGWIPSARHAWGEYLACLEANYRLDAVDNDFFGVAYVSNDPRLAYFCQKRGIRLMIRLMDDFVAWGRRNYPEVPRFAFRAVLLVRFWNKSG